MTYIQLQEIVSNGKKALNQYGILKAEKNSIIKNIAAAEKQINKYKDCPLPGNFD